MNWDTAFKILAPLEGLDWDERYRLKTKACYELARLVPADRCIVELGTWYGVGAIALWLGSKDGRQAKVYTLDDWTDKIDVQQPLRESYRASDRMIAERNARKVGVDLVFLAGDAHEPPWTWQEKIGLLVRDFPGRDAFESDLAAWGPHVAPGGFVAFRCPYRQDVLASGEWELHAEYPEAVLTVIRKRGNRDSG